MPRPPGFVSVTFAPVRSSAVRVFVRAFSTSASYASRKRSNSSRPALMDHRHHQRPGAVLLLDVDSESEVHLAVLDPVRLALDLLEVVGHHRHVVGRGARDRVGDQVGEGDLPRARLQFAPARVEHRHGQCAEARRRGDLQRLLHVAARAPPRRPSVARSSRPRPRTCRWRSRLSPGRRRWRPRRRARRPS